MGLMSVQWLVCPCTLLPPTVVVEVVMVLCWMTCCWEHTGAGLPAGLLSGPEEKAERSLKIEVMRKARMCECKYKR